MTDQEIIEKLTRELEAATKPKWISVEDQMPPCGESVLVWDGDEIGIDFTDIEVDYGTEYFSNTQEYTTHWQPLPEPPL